MNILDSSSLLFPIPCLADIGKKDTASRVLDLIMAVRDPGLDVCQFSLFPHPKRFFRKSSESHL